MTLQFPNCSNNFKFLSRVTTLNVESYWFKLRRSVKGNGRMSWLIAVGLEVDDGGSM